MEARAVWSSVRQWIPAPDYLESLWEVFVHYWLKTTDGVQHTLTDPANFLPLLACALLGIVVPVLLLIMWRLFNWQKEESRRSTSPKWRPPLRTSEIRPSKSPSLSGSSVDSTRIMRNFELDEDAVKKLAGMEFHGKLKTATLRARAEKLEEGMTREEREKKQLEDIFKMMQNQGEKFGIENKADLYDQMKLYTK
ncbi:hypothetical protein M3Y99_01843300 [Aphelenchoides fujianensis]|nr:hypothetical protein M3Y99_01843300 [Aphelenchoides fujianensis]